MEVVRQLEHEEIGAFIQLVKLFQEVFEMKDFNMPPADYLKGLLSKDNFVVFVAVIDNKIVAGLTGYILDTYYTSGAYFYLYDLAVQAQYQRRGIGTKLIKAVNERFQNTNIVEIFVQADRDDDYALEFYRSTGGIEQEVVGFSYPLQHDSKQLQKD